MRHNQRDYDWRCPECAQQRDITQIPCDNCGALKTSILCPIALTATIDRLLTRASEIAIANSLAIDIDRPIALWPVGHCQRCDRALPKPALLCRRCRDDLTYREELASAAATGDWSAAAALDELDPF